MPIKTGRSLVFVMHIRSQVLKLNLAIILSRCAFVGCAAEAENAQLNNEVKVNTVDTKY